MINYFTHEHTYHLIITPKNVIINIDNVKLLYSTKIKKQSIKSSKNSILLLRKEGDYEVYIIKNISTRFF